MFDSDSSAPRKEPSLRRLCQRESTHLTSGGDLMQQTQSLESDVNLTPSEGSASPVSSTSAFLLGVNNYKALDDVNLPDFVREHHATLTFPEKVSLP